MEAVPARDVERYHAAALEMVDEARRIVGPDAIVGLSTHDEAQIEAAARTSATYIAVGPIYGTATKATGYTARGLDLVRRAALMLASLALGEIARKRDV